MADVNHRFENKFVIASQNSFFSLIDSQVWPFLFSHYPFDSNDQERIDIDRNRCENYEKLIGQWQSAENLIDRINLERLNQRKNTKVELEIDRFASDNGQCSGKTVPNEPMKVCLTAAESLQRKDSTISNEVFYEVKFDRFLDLTFFIIIQDCTIHTVTLGQDETSNEANPMIIIARTRTEPVLDRSSPFNIIDTSSGEETNLEKPNRSRSSSLNSTGDIYMDAVDVLDEEQTGWLTLIFLEIILRLFFCRQFDEVQTVYKGNNRIFCGKYSSN